MEVSVSGARQWGGMGEGVLLLSDGLDGMCRFDAIVGSLKGIFCCPLLGLLLVACFTLSTLTGLTGSLGALLFFEVEASGGVFFGDLASVFCFSLCCSFSILSMASCIFRSSLL